MANPTHYRSEIDGLRGLAVLSVVFFHANLAGFGGGYVGVDVFFVISGFLITQLLTTEIGLGLFYERRIRRLAPALFLVLGVCVPFACLTMLVSELKDFSASLGSTLLFSSNVFFLFSSYFDPLAATRPLLHTWSLSLEEQFYFVYPFVLIFCLRCFRRKTWLILATLATASFAYSELRLQSFASASFYLLPTRAWELLVGALIAKMYSKRLRATDQGATALCLGGFALIAISVLVYDVETPIPGRYALLPVAGTSILLMFSRGSRLGMRILSWRPLVSTGLSSYAIYLWHQPLFAFARLYAADELSLTVRVVIILMTLALGALTTRFIERPFRDPARVSRKHVWLFFVGCTVCLIAVAYALHLNAERIVKSQIPKQNWNLVLPSENLKSGVERGCFLRSRVSSARQFNESCWKFEDSKFEASVEKQKVLLIGDSHAASVAGAARITLEKQGVFFAQLNASYCLPLVRKFPKNKTHTATPRCEEINEFIHITILNEHYDAILIAAHYYQWFSSGNPDATYPAYRADFLASLRELVSGGQTVYVIGQVPIWEPSLPSVLRKELRSSGELSLYSPRGLNQIALSNELDLGRDVNATGAHYLSLIEGLCTPEGCLRFTPDRAALTFDASHLSAGGSEAIFTRLVLPKLRVLQH